MASKEVAQMPADDLYARWQEHIERIYQETVYLFTTRYKFREVQEMFRTNQALNKIGGNVYQWLLGMWGRDAIMGIRRELDEQGGTINLVNLMHDVEDRPDVLTRRRWLAFIKPGDSDFMPELMNRSFDSLGGVSLIGGTKDPQDDVIAPERVRADRRNLQAGTKKAFDYAQRMVAHRTPIGELEITVADINGAMDAIEDTFKKYYLIFTGNTLVQAEAAIQYNWTEPFTIPWLRQPDDDD
jgi:hypothetical protein